MALRLNKLIKEYQPGGTTPFYKSSQPWSMIDPNYAVKESKDEVDKGYAVKENSQPTSRSNKDYIYSYFANKGYSPIHISAIIGNLQQENALFNPTTKNSIGGLGIAQWLGSRKKNLLKNYQNPYSLDAQLDFLDKEIQGSGWTNNVGGKNAFLNAKTPEEATFIFRKDFERPREAEANDKARIRYAYAVLGQVAPNYTGNSNQDYAQSNYPQLPTYSNEKPIDNNLAFTLYNTELLKQSQEREAERDRLDQEKAKQDAISARLQAENEQIQQAIQQKELEKKQFLESIPQMAVVGDSTHKQNPYTTFLQNSQTNV